MFFPLKMVIFTIIKIHSALHRRFLQWFDASADTAEVLIQILILRVSMKMTNIVNIIDFKSYMYHLHVH